LRFENIFVEYENFIESCADFVETTRIISNIRRRVRVLDEAKEI
jgi:hypothetical protein